MRNEVDQQSALSALEWEPLKAQRGKAKAIIVPVPVPIIVSV